MTVRRLMVLAGLLVLACVTIVTMQAQGAAPAQGGRGGRGGGQAAAPPPSPGNLVTGAWGDKALTPDSRGWGWMTKSYVSPSTQRPFYNRAKEMLFQDKQVTSVTISAFNPEQYCEARKHWDYIWFEMQHSTMSMNEIQRMIGSCVGIEGGAPMIRMPDALEANIQKATDLGVLGLIIPTVDDALEARDAARFSRYPPFGRRSSGAGTAGTFWANVPGGYQNSINDNFLVVVMLETLESIINADEIANTFGLDVVIQGNNDLSRFSGWGQNDGRYQNLLNISHNAALKAGKYWGNAGSQYLTGNPLSADTRFVQNGPARDGFSFPSRGRGAAEPAEPTVGVPGGRRGGGTP